MVHLLVTLAFALMELVPYVVQYYRLENGTQRLYAQYDELLRRRIEEGADG